jgi:hypothetical protein
MSESKTSMSIPSASATRLRTDFNSVALRELYGQRFINLAQKAIEKASSEKKYYCDISYFHIFADPEQQPKWKYYQECFKLIGKSDNDRYAYIDDKIKQLRENEFKVTIVHYYIHISW